MIGKSAFVIGKSFFVIGKTRFMIGKSNFMIAKQSKAPMTKIILPGPGNPESLLQSQNRKGRMKFKYSEHTN